MDINGRVYVDIRCCCCLDSLLVSSGFTISSSAVVTEVAGVAGLIPIAPAVAFEGRAGTGTDVAVVFTIAP